jgi:arginine deiminase
MDLLTLTLDKIEARKSLITNVCQGNNKLRERIETLEIPELARQLIEGVSISRDNLKRYLSKEKFDLRPLHNFFFTRDSSIVINDYVLIGLMASKVRQREAMIMKTIFTYHPSFEVNPVEIASTNNSDCGHCSVEGGDVIVARDDIMVIGNGSRTTSQGIDKIIEQVSRFSTNSYNIIVQELPHTSESFIHLDMVFTILDRDKFMAFEPLILKKNKYQTVHIAIDNHRVKFIKEVPDIPSALKSLGMDLEPVICGGTDDQWVQEREQWHSGANFLALEPGKLLGYSRNIYTLEALSKHNFEILKATDVINGVSNPDDYKRCVIGIDGAELSRGGGGARCMTMPLNRQKID